jgi:hypothetical protein
MARRLVATDVYSPAWKSLFGFWPDVQARPEVAGLKALGVHRVSMRIGCTSLGEFFTDLAEAVAEKDVAVDVMWLKQVRDLCEALTPAIAEELRRVARPDDEDLNGQWQEEVAMGNFLVDVSVHFQDEAFVSADFLLPAIEFARVTASQ